MDGRQLTLVANLGPELLEPPAVARGELIHAVQGRASGAETLEAWATRWYLRQP
jgi:hypothetical protein